VRCRRIAGSPHIQWLVAFTPLAAFPVRARENAATTTDDRALAMEPDTSVRDNQSPTFARSARCESC